MSDNLTLPELMYVHCTFCNAEQIIDGWSFDQHGWHFPAVTCDACGQPHKVELKPSKIQTYTFSKVFVRPLRRLAQLGTATRTDLEMTTHQYSRFAHTRVWGLINHVHDYANLDKRGRPRALPYRWGITERGKLFAAGSIQIPRRMQRCVGFDVLAPFPDLEYIYIDEALPLKDRDGDPKRDSAAYDSDEAMDFFEKEFNDA